jgi:hypothetical protein
MFNVNELHRDFGDRNVNKLAKQLAEVLSQREFDITKPIVMRNSGSGPVFDIKQSGSSQHKLITATDSDGKVVQLGFGAASTGITANEFLPNPNFALDPGLINEVFSTQGNIARNPDRSLLGEKRSGSGIPHTRKPFVPVAGWADAFAGLQKSNDTEHAPDSAVKLTRDGQQYWWCREPWKWQVVRCTVTAINADTLTCNVIANGKVVAESITVAKPCHLRQSLWDGVTAGTITYTYTSSQEREADLGSSTTEDQAVSPLYTTTGPCPVIYAAWVGNSTGVANVGWLDLNNDARQWFAV